MWVEVAHEAVAYVLPVWLWVAGAVILVLLWAVWPWLQRPLIWLTRRPVS